MVKFLGDKAFHFPAEFGFHGSREVGPRVRQTVSHGDKFGPGLAKGGKAPGVAPSNPPPPPAPPGGNHARGKPGLPPTLPTPAAARAAAGAFKMGAKFGAQKAIQMAAQMGAHARGGAGAPPGALNAAGPPAMPPRSPMAGPGGPPPPGAGGPPPMAIPGMKDGGHFIAEMGLKKGALHRDLGVPEGDKIPDGKLSAAANGRYGKLAEKRAHTAQTLKGLKKGSSR